MQTNNNFLVSILTILVSCHLAISQNRPPEIYNLNVIDDNDQRKMVIQYDLKDLDDDQVAISLELIHPEGRLVKVQQSSFLGDVGPFVSPGRKKSFDFDYSSYTLSGDYKLRLVADDGHKLDISLVSEQAELKSIKKLISTFSIERYYEQNLTNIEKTKQNIEKLFIKHGLTTQRQAFVYQEYDAHNIIGVLQGTNSNAAILVVGAHFDTAEGSQGADDNASGVAGMLEVMKVLSQYQFENTICFVAFDLEEEGLIGSKEFVRQFVHEDENNILGVLNLDMIGFYSERPKSQIFPGALQPLFPEVYEQISEDGFKGNFILCFGDEYSDSMTEVFKQEAAQYVDDLLVVNLLIPDQGKFAPDAFRASDHVSFWNSNIPAISIGDTGGARNFNVTTVKDTKETLDMNFVLKVVRATIVTAIDLTVANRRCIKEISFESEDSRKLTYQTN